ncbi:hypothetical protein MLD38_036871 [Melastoma candidum]|uniref:Uncharacterized protein n=1 Tax=Melastoma candidum TaxID=119954 RepID=A0ACB9LLA0_9MYRT|nr:hypothetical protein MLD38_036871 [Melastoma candidum]
MEAAKRRIASVPTIVVFILFFWDCPVKSEACETDPDPWTLPPGFLFGTASSSYQYEGAYKSDGKGLSNWDEFAHGPGNIIDGSNGDVAVDHYHRYKEDISLMESLGVNSYRFSISWARILPKGRFGNLNLAGIQYYNSLIDRLLQKGIQPFVTLTHFDIPQELEDRYGGWLSPESREDFGYYADICFKYFGDRVKYWVTINEPNMQVVLGYRRGQFPPSHCSAPFGNCSSGNSDEEPFTVAHNLILGHAMATYIYRTKYQKKQGGLIGIVLHIAWFEPFSDSPADKRAAERAISFSVNWFLDPIIFGRYPGPMVELVGLVLPEFMRKDKEMLKGGLDFIGINHYTSYYAKDCISASCEPGRGVTRTEGYFLECSERNGVPIGELTSLDWLNVYPEGMEKTVNYIRNRYNNTPMFITENGYGETEGNEDPLMDTNRVNYMDSYLNSLLRAVREGADVRGYFAWSLLDNFEWEFGYTVRFGLHHVDYQTLKRTPKLSAAWFQQFIARHSIRPSNYYATRPSE